MDKKFLEGARQDCPDNVKFSVDEETDKTIPTEHTVGLVEVIDDSTEETFVRILATGDSEGMTWAWTYAQENHERPEALALVDLAEMMEQGGAIDFH